MTEGVTGPAWAAAMRAGREHLRTLKRKAEDAKLAAFGFGRLGGSSHQEEVEELCAEHFRAAAKATATTYYGLKGRAAAGRADLLRQALTPFVIETLRIFDDNDGSGSLFPKPTDRRAGLGLDLQRIIDDTCSDLAAGVFGINGAANGQAIEAPPPRLTDHGTKLAILEIYARTKSAHRLNVLGRSYQPGPLETQLGLQFTDIERAEAARSMDQLLNDSLLRPTYTDVTDPENWLAITEAGRAALAAGATDDLEAVLSPLGQQLVDMRNGARAAFLSARPDNQRQAAFSARELLVQVLHALAPDEAVRSQPGFGEPRITRKARVRYALRNKAGGYSDSTAEMVESLAGFVEALHDKLSAEAHGRETARQAKHLIQSVDMILETLLL
ncbi:hypothetical protein ASC89_22075 [Devosia sp. Root413D1]|uniref:pPIWI-associating nuclease domain-containing protein n=1 Tax=Devosia sp. Root413D1 TaxID=1736531 RepID=UPI0006FDFB41|nr:hypothetical protein [Devosia sp. Root413D1]KQW75627.1 hypothetical protein ASC89_22075 [Devosia sp. Root413D1]